MTRRCLHPSIWFSGWYLSNFQPYNHFLFSFWKLYNCKFLVYFYAYICKHSKFRLINWLNLCWKDWKSCVHNDCIPYVNRPLYNGGDLRKCCSTIAFVVIMTQSFYQNQCSYDYLSSYFVNNLRYLFQKFVNAIISVTMSHMIYLKNKLKGKLTPIICRLVALMLITANRQNRKWILRTLFVPVWYIFL